jgi:hypothetical protein
MEKRLVEQTEISVETDEETSISTTHNWSIRLLCFLKLICYSFNTTRISRKCIHKIQLNNLYIPFWKHIEGHKHFVLYLLSPSNRL